MTGLEIENQKAKALLLYKKFYRFFTQDFKVTFFSDSIHVKNKEFSNEIELSHSNALEEFEELLTKQKQVFDEILKV